MHFGLEGNAVDKGAAEISVTGCCFHAPYYWAEFDFAAVEEATAELTFGGEAEAVAGGAKGFAHGADEADAALRAGDFPDDGGAVAGVAGGGVEGAEAVFDVAADFGFGDKARFVFATEGGAAEGHVFDEADGEVGGHRQCGEVGVLVVVDAFHGDAIHFGMSEAGIDGGADAAPNVIEVGSTGDVAEAITILRVHADGESVEAGGFEGGGVLIEERAVGGHGEVGEAGEGAEHGDEFGEVVADEGFTAGEFERGDAELDGGTGDGDDLLEGEKVVARHPVELFLRHAIDAAEVTAVGDADAKGLDGADVARAGDVVRADVGGIGDGQGEHHVGVLYHAEKALVG